MQNDNYSRLIQDRAHSPAYRCDHLDSAKLESDVETFQTEYSFPNSNGGITLFGELVPSKETKKIQNLRYITNISGPPLGFIDGLVELCQGRELSTLGFLSFGEVESFLRDRNDVPAAPGQGHDLVRYYEVFNHLKDYFSLKKKVSLDPARGTASPTIDEYEPFKVRIFDPEKRGPFQGLSTELKIKLVEDALDYYVRALLQRDGGDVECLHVMENLVVVVFHGNCGTCGMSLTTTMDFIKKVLRTELHDSNLDIITDN